MSNVHPSGKILLNDIHTDAVWRWLEAGWKDFLQRPLLSVFYGLLAVGGGLGIIVVLIALDRASLVPVAVASFALLGPFLAMGIYEKSRRLEAGEPVHITDMLFVRTASPTQIALVSFFLMFAVLVWLRIAMLLYALFAHGQYQPLGDFTTFALTQPAGIAMLVVGTAIGAVIALAIFSISALSFPMMMHRDVDAFTAIATSIKSVTAHWQTMLLWAWLIAVIVAAGIATAFIGLALAFPLLGHATWHAYRDMVPEVPATDDAAVADPA
ncbi:MAG: DUF2189 domain-containing protein [Pseudomonadota bacterium]